jgi:plasmid stability protein
MATPSRSITVRNVPVRVHRELAARAARRGQSLQELVLSELARVAARPSAVDLVERIRARKDLTGTQLSPQQILSHRDADRR